MNPLKFVAPRTADPNHVRGTKAEEQVVHDLGRAFDDVPDIFLFHGLRFEAPRSAWEDDHAQIDHLILHRSGMVLIETKSTGDGTGEFHIDERGQWTRRSGGGGRGFNFESPITQANKQVDALRLHLGRADPPLLDKTAGVLQQKFNNFPILPLIAIANTAKVTGRGARKHDGVVMKTDQLVDRIREEIDSHRRASGLLSLLRDNAPDRGIYTLSDAAQQRICAYLLKHHRPTTVSVPPSPPLPPAPRPPASPPPAPPTPPAASAPPRTSRPEPLTCRHCRSINVQPVYRKDYCLLCDECARYTPLDRTCTRCGKEATIRKRGPEFFRACDKAGGCGAEVVFHASAGG